MSVEVLDIKDAVSKLSYKPGWKFDYESHAGMKTLIITTPSRGMTPGLLMTRTG